MMVLSRVLWKVHSKHAVAALSSRRHAGQRSRQPRYTTIRDATDARRPGSIRNGYRECMARMTPKEAAAVNVLFGYLAGREGQPPREVVLALETLASRAYNRLQGGVNEASVREQWPGAYATPPA